MAVQGGGRFLVGEVHLTRRAMPGTTKLAAAMLDEIARSLSLLHPTAPTGLTSPYRFRAKGGKLERVDGRLPESQSQNLALTVVYVPYSCDSSHTYPSRGVTHDTQGVAAPHLEAYVGASLLTT